MKSMTKAEIRADLRARHQGREVRDAQSDALCRHILDSNLYKSARVVGGYMPLMREADILPVLRDALRQGKTLALPLCTAPPYMSFRLVQDLNQLVPGAYGIREPSADAMEILPSQMDLLLVPLEGIDRMGMRLGKGGGFYDCLLQDLSVQTLGCALSWQWVDALPADPWDKPLDACADARGIHFFDADEPMSCGKEACYEYQESSED